MFRLLCCLCLLLVAQVVGGSTWYEYNGSCYTIANQQNMTFANASDVCTAQGTKLAELETLGELSFLQTLVNGSLGSYWLGLMYYNSTQKFLWTTSLQEPSTAMWIEGEPNLTGLCVRLTTDLLMNSATINPKEIYLLADNPCTFSYRPMCEKLADQTRPVYYSVTASSCVNCCPLPPVTSRTRMSCASTCARRADCIGFQFVKSSFQCTLVTFNRTCSQSMTGSVYKQMQPRC